MRRTLILVLCCCTVGYGQSKNAPQKETQPEEEWRIIPFLAGDRVYALNLRTFIMLPNKQGRFWTKDYPRNGAIKSERAKILKLRKESNLSIQGYEKYHSTMIQREVDCQKRSLRFLQVIDYNEDGEVLDSIDAKDLDGWTDVAPGTLADYIVIMACAERIRRYVKELDQGQKKPSN